MRELFKVDNISYEFVVNDNSITFAILRGVSKRGIYPFAREKYSLFDDDNEFDDVNLSLSPFKVFEKVIQLSLLWIRKAQPYFFTFSTDSERKGKVYDYLVNKTLKNNTDISKRYFYNKDKSGNYRFYRKHIKPMAA